ncbi:PTS transporter subunit IIC, partial [Aerococcus mictus]
MNLLLYFIQTIFSQAVFIIGLVCLIGLLIQKKSFDKVISSVIKAMIGFLLINEGGKFLGMALLPLQPMFIKIFNLNVNVPSIDQAMGGLEGVGF